MIKLREAVLILLMKLKANQNMIIMEKMWERTAFLYKQLRKGIS
jgi:cytochrome c oxidase subunit IV